MSFWACARTEVQRESVAERHLTLSGFESYLPLVRTPTRLNGHAPARSVGRIAPLFSSYIFVRVIDRWCAIQHTIGIAQLLMSGDQPALVSEAIIADLRAREDAAGLVQLPSPPGLRRGQRVRIVSGPLQDHFAIYQGMRPRARVEVLLTFLGREQHVTLARGAVLPLR